MNDDPARLAVQVPSYPVDPDRLVEPEGWRQPVAIAGSPRRLVAGWSLGLPIKTRSILIGVVILLPYATILANQGRSSTIIAAVAITLAAALASIAGLAFSAIGQALLAPLSYSPVQLVRILMLCSIATQSYGIVSLWRHMAWRALPPYLIGGAVGLPAGVYLLLHLDRTSFQTVIGALLVVYGIYLLARRPVVLTAGGWPIEAGMGFLGGLTGGFAAFPGGPMAIWCSMKGWDKSRQRGVYQPFIFVMQLMGLATIPLMQGHSGRTISDMSVLARDALVFLPGTLIGSWFGLQVFHGLSDRGFGRCFAVLLAVSGLLMLAQSA